MLRPLIATVLLALAAALPASAQDPVSAANTVEAEVQGTAQPAYEVFARSCSPCHSDRLRRPKGGFGFVLDLRQLSRAGEYISRGRSADSALWRTIVDGTMPPPRSDHPALTEAEREAVRAWIDDGAPPGPVDPSTLAELPATAEVSATAHYVGQLHPIVLHFPIGLLVAAALAELAFILRGQQRFRPAAEFCLLLGTLGSCAATISGWFFASDLEYALTSHRWLGIATTLFALAACRLAVQVRELPAASAPTRAYRFALFATIALLVVTSHLGGTATWSDSVFAR